MAIPITIPSTPAVTAALLNGKKVVFALEPSGGSQINFRGKSANYQQQTARTKYFVPAAVITDGVIVGRVLTGATERSFEIVLDESTQDAYDQFVAKSSVTGKGRVWVIDETDAAGTAAAMSNEFDCTVTLGGSMPFDTDNVTQFTITVDITGTFTLTRNADVIP